MRELKCPKCGNVFSVDEADYAAILSQVRNVEFDAELDKRVAEIKKQQRAADEAARLKAAKDFDRQLSVKDVEMSKMQSEIDRLKNESKAELSSLAADKNLEIARLQAKIDSFDADSKLKMESMRAQMNEEISELKQKLSSSDNDRRIAVLEEQNRAKDEIRQVEARLEKADSDLRLIKKEHDLELSNLRSSHEQTVKMLREEVERQKNFKAQLSTKMIGESLEIHCSTLFNRIRLDTYPNAYFEKDNDASGGSKGDFIFRDYVIEDGEKVEYISIMFEMKNEMDTTSTKHKNEDFFAKLDKDRREKNCEYAVLVSMLEPDNELYNDGIVDVSYRFDRMYVIRPQFFLSIISLLCRSSRRGAYAIARLQRELSVAKAQSIDVTRFEEKRDKFAAEFLKFVKAHKEKHDKAISAIDKAIEDAEKQIEKLKGIKALFDTSTQKLERAGEVIENDFTIKKLTYGNPTMKARFEEARSKTPELE